MKFDDAHFAHALFQNVFIDFLDVFFDLFGERFGRVNFKRIRRHIRHDSRRKIAGEQRRLELARERAQNLLRHTRGDVFSTLILYGLVIGCGKSVTSSRTTSSAPTASRSALVP